MRIFPDHWLPSAILMLPAISSFAVGEVVPIPTLPFAFIVNFSVRANPVVSDVTKEIL